MTAVIIDCHLTDEVQLVDLNLNVLEKASAGKNLHVPASSYIRIGVIYGSELCVNLGIIKSLLLKSIKNIPHILLN